MKKFKFRLQTPLKIKQMIEDINKQELIKAIIKKNEEQKRLQILCELRDYNQERLTADLCNGSLRIQEIKYYEYYLNYLFDATKQQQKNVIEAEQLYEHRRHSFLELKKNRQILEKLRDKKLEIYKLMLQHEEQKISDQIASERFTRSGEC